MEACWLYPFLLRNKSNNQGGDLVNNRSYWSGLLAGGLMGAILGMAISSRQKPPRKLMMQSGEIGDQARKVMHGISKGMGDMLRR